MVEGGEAGRPKRTAEMRAAGEATELSLAFSHRGGGRPGRQQTGEPLGLLGSFGSQVAHHRFQARSHPEFLKDVLQMHAHGIDAQVQGVGDHAVRMALAQQHQELFFPRGEPSGFALDASRRAEGLDHAPGNLAGQWRSPVPNLQQCGSQFSGLSTMQQVTIRSRLQGLEHQFLFTQGGQDDDLSLGQLRFQLPNAGEPGVERQKNIHQHNIRAIAGNGVPGLGSRGTGTTADEIGK